jgi:threonine/homoserine/homoserine lactone efflux protein
MTVDHFIAYFFVLFIATITPGPSMLLAISHGANHGIGKSLLSGFGNVIGNLLMALVSLLGLGAILIASGFVFNFIKWAGILYLAFIGITLFLEPANPRRSADAPESKPAALKKGNRLFIDGFFIAIGNPKGILFFIALFPQFINVKSTITCSIVIFSTLAIVAFGCYMLYAAFGARLSKWFHLHSFRKAFNRITGSIFLGTGLALAFSKK